MRQLRLIFMLSAFIGVTSSLGTSWGASISSLDDIKFWVGNGTKRAALLFDWQGDSQVDEALGWGYRWDGAATGEDMLQAVVAADPRLYMKIGDGGGLGPSVFGVGYDQNDDGQFFIDDGTSFDADGIAFTGPADGAFAVDPQDLYAEGWYVDGFWHYGTAASNPYAEGAWTSSSVGLAGRTLVNGGWDSLAFTPTFSNQAFAENPTAASTPYGADFDGDLDVDGDDFLSWQRGFGIASGASHIQGDADFDGDVDQADLDYWSSQYGTAPLLAFADTALRNGVLVVPEPLPVVLLLGAAVEWTVFFRSLRFATGRLTHG